MARKKRSPAAPPGKKGRDRLLRAALKLFGTVGFDGTSVRELAREAQVSIGLVRNCFGSKEGLRGAVDRLVLDQLKGFYDVIFEGPEQDFARRMLTQTVEFVKDNRDVISYMRHALLHPRPANGTLFDEYYDIHRRYIHALNEHGFLSSKANLRWAPFMTMFLQIGPLIIEPFAARVLGTDIFAPRLVRERNEAYRVLLEQGIMRLPA